MFVNVVISLFYAVIFCPQDEKYLNCLRFTTELLRGYLSRKCWAFGREALLKALELFKLFGFLEEKEVEM